MTNDSRIWLLAGFGGGEAHWGDFPEELARRLGVRAEFIDWAKEVAGALDLEEAARFLAQRALSEGQRPILIGYSMGGRLALEAAFQAPGAFQSVVALSAHPGFDDEDEKKSRRAEDAAWAKLLLEDEGLFWQRWHQRPALAGSTSPMPVNWTPSERERWAQLLVTLSTGAQQNLAERLANCFVLPPVLTVCGLDDTKFCQLQQRFPSTLKSAQIPGGHRLPLDNPQGLAHTIAAFLRPELTHD